MDKKQIRIEINLWWVPVFLACIIIGMVIFR